MGRPHTKPPARKGPNRRDFFKQSGGSTAALAAATLLPMGSALAADAVPAFQHGVASGDPLSDRVILWTRVTPNGPRGAVPVQWVVARDPGLTQVVLRGTAKTNPDRDYTVKVDAIGLQPGTTYYYRFKAEGTDSPIGRTRTLPVGAVDRLRMAVVSCSNHAYGYFNAYRQIAARADLDLVLHLGDYLYEYGTNQYGTARPTEPATEITSLADYRMRHAQYKRDADLQALHRQHPMIAIWDDHEITNDAWKDGAQNHTEGAEGVWNERVNRALKAYFEWMPTRAVDTTDLRKNWRSFRFGNLADVVMLEERLAGRAQQLPAGGQFTQTGAFTDASRSLLGSEQEAWVADTLRRSTTQWRFLGQGVMFAQLKGVGAANAAGGGAFLNADQWDGYQPARNRIYDILKGNATTPGVGNVVVLTGDIHSSWAADLTQDPNNPDLASGGYNPATGEGSRAVEFVGTSVTSPGVNDPQGSTAAFLRSQNPHFKYIDLMRRGYMLIDATPQRVVGEWWYVDTVASISNVQVFGTAFEVQAGTNHLVPSAQTTPRANPPLLAP
ncbi:MAG: alkaline phosphatase D family protein [Aquincola tertiaricarbonis]|uniref:alkaline phosphatase D family protein n=1 Tax=Aquincola sp. J276 TaxID=2898432 RepID=UPI00215129FB|nr:alkaline phosphatase D family protein [Aquincola sp. J276]MCR5865737.1 alkaline phosphatase D family protein [Aquincola sp. J276]